MSRCGHDLTFDFAVVALIFKFLSGLYFGNCRCRKLILYRVISWGCKCERYDGALIWLYYSDLDKTCLGYFLETQGVEVATW